MESQKKWLISLLLGFYSSFKSLLFELFAFRIVSITTWWALIISESSWEFIKSLDFFIFSREKDEMNRKCVDEWFIINTFFRDLKSSHETEKETTPALGEEEFEMYLNILVLSPFLAALYYSNFHL